MLRGRDIFLIALACSIGLHAAALEGVWLYGFIRGLGVVPAVRHPEMVISLDDMGEADGQGGASNRSPGVQPLVAREADEDQAILSRDPVGFGRFGEPPSKWTGPTGDGGAPSAARALPDVPPVAPMPLAAPTPQQVAAAQVPPVPTALPAPNVQITPIHVEPVVVATAQTSAPQPKAIARPAQASAESQKPGLPIRSADPLPESDSDSDPFVRNSGTVIFRNGQLEARLGRKVKTTRPRILIPGMLDIATRSSPKVVLEVHIADSGKVTDVRISHSSGSNNIDEPTRLCVYDWWFEPAKDKAGKPTPDVIFFTIEFL